MIVYISTAEAARHFKLDRSRIKQLLAQRRMKGQRKIGRAWVMRSPPQILPPKRK